MDQFERTANQKLPNSSSSAWPGLTFCPLCLAVDEKAARAGAQGRKRDTKIIKEIRIRRKIRKTRKRPGRPYLNSVAALRLSK